MKKVLTVILLLFVVSFVQSQCEPGRYRDMIFTEVESEQNIIYGENLSYTGNTEQLKMDVYWPANDGEQARALVIVCHGGYFLAGDKEGEDMQPLCADLPRMGYVVASINYRLGLAFEKPLMNPYGLTLMRAVQDLRAAIRWFRKDAENGNQFHIDPDQIYCGGASAGGFMAMHHAWMQEDEIPNFIDMSAPGLEGGIDGNSGNPGYSSEVNAIFNVSGALGDTTWIDPGETPVCLFHGDADGTVPYDSDMFVLFGLVDVVELDGSNSISQKLDEVGIEYCFEIGEGLGHVPYLGNPAVYDTTLSILSNFLSHYICDEVLDCEYREIEVGVDEHESKNELVVFPNPAVNSIKVLASVANKNSEIIICDMSGKTHKVISAAIPIELDVFDLSSGMYYLTVRNNNGVLVTKFIKE